MLSDIITEFVGTLKTEQQVKMTATRLGALKKGSQFLPNEALLFPDIDHSGTVKSFACLLVEL